MQTRPSHAAMNDAELALRTLHAFQQNLQSRLALARLTGTRREFANVPESQLVRLTAACEGVTQLIDSVLEAIDPNLAALAASIADIECQREFDRPPGERAAHLRLAARDVDRPA